MERIQEIARKRIKRLLKLAETEKRKRRYIELAKKISKKYNVTIPKQKKRRICKKCGRLLVPGENMKIRITSKPKKTVVYTCLKCGHKQKYGYEQGKINKQEEQ